MDIRTIQKPIAEFRNATDDSDIDVIVVSEDFKSMNEDQRLDLLYEKSLQIRPEIHPWGFTPEEIERASELTTVGYVRTAGFRFT